MKTKQIKSDHFHTNEISQKNLKKFSVPHYYIFTMLFLFILFMVLSINGYSQRLTFGMSYGLNVSYWRGETDLFASDIEAGMREEGYSLSLKELPRLGINIGVSLNYKPTKWLIIQPEVNYINEGTRLRGTCDIEGIDVNLRFALNVNYVHFPVVVKFITPKGFYFSAGPYADILTHARMKVTASALGESDSEKEKLPFVNPFNWGLIGGIGYQTRELGIEFRYLNGMKSVLNQETGNYLFKNSVFELKMDFYFGKTAQQKKNG